MSKNDLGIAGKSELTWPPHAVTTFFKSLISTDPGGDIERLVRNNLPFKSLALSIASSSTKPYLRSIFCREGHNHPRLWFEKLTRSHKK